ncbi:MAG: ComEA family DNA-binding protein [Candidatus Omnitrophica bacterium]|nr:ComEA family DNA-binding protein [Candidatus Omnitrophota bacterium]
MLHLTLNERKALLCIGLIILVGAGLRQIKKHPLPVQSSQMQQETTLNINSASHQQLQSLPGVGPAIALAIIQYRSQNGPFAGYQDLKNVKGIGDKKIESIKDLVVF